jgi:hypothetical protein
VVPHQKRAPFAFLAGECRISQIFNFRVVRARGIACDVVEVKTSLNWVVNKPDFQVVIKRGNNTKGALHLLHVLD